MIRRLAIVAALLAACGSAAAGEVAKAQLDIVGLSLEVEREPVTTGADIPSRVQTIFGGRKNDEAPAVPGMSVLGELTGPGILTPISLVTVPGHAFSIPALPEEGEYALQNIRLVGAGGEFLQQAVPSFAVIRVTGILQTQVRVRQLTADELRARGINLDARNFDVFEYTMVFAVDGKEVVIPYPVIIDRRTHTIVQVPRESPYSLPPLTSNQQPPRFQPPDMFPMNLEEIGTGGSVPQSGGTQNGGGAQPQRPRIPAALVVPNGFGVLHQFFAVILQVDNASPDTKIRLDSISATVDAPSQLRVAKVMPAVSIGQPVPIHDSATGATYLVAGATGKAEWTLEALKAGTHAVDIEVLATYQKDGQPDVPLRGHVATSLVVSDPRFQINFSHPDVVRKDETYTAYAFLTNLSPQRQHVVLDTTAVPPCTSGAAAANICRVDGDGTFELDLEPGQMVPVPYRLTSDITGHVYAAAGSANDETLGVSVRLTMGVSASGIPLSPATLVMPHYAQFLPPDLVADHLQLLGLGYSLATAPLNAFTAKFPRVIRTDVFQCAQELARAGQRVFITNPSLNRDAFFHLALDLLGNVERVDQLAIAPELREWDQLRRMESSGRRAAAAIARELERVESGRTAQQFFDDFAAATSHRSPFFFAYAESGTMKITGATTGAVLDASAQNIPHGELMTFSGGRLAMIGRWKEDLRVTITPAGASTVLHLIWPDAANGAHLRSTITINGPTTLDVKRGSGGSPIANAPIRILGAAQDLFLDSGGHLVSVLFNRPVTNLDRDDIALTINVPKAGYTVTRRNVAGQELQIPGAALQGDGKILNVSFDKTLSRNASYLVAVDAHGDVVPRIDNDRPGAILTGKVLRANNTPIANVAVELHANGVRQVDVTGADGRFLYEFVPRDVDANISGHYELQCAAEGKVASLEGTVRLPGEVHTVNLVFLGRGSAKGQVRYSDGQVLANVSVTIGSTLFNQFRTGTSDASGNYLIEDLPVGPLTFSVVDPSGRPTFAANHIRTPGEVVTQDLVIQKRDAPGTGTVRIRVRRSDTNALVPGARVGVYSQGYGLQDGYTDGAGFIEFARVPAGLISILASEWNVTRESVGIELDLRADQLLDQTVTLHVHAPGDPARATLEGTITRDDPGAPNDPARDALVPGAIVSISGLPPVTAAADGTYTYPDVPLIASQRTITVFDPSTGRRGAYTLPTLQSGSNHFSMKLATAAPEGIATMRVRLYDSRGVPVAGYRVISPGFPPTDFTDKGNGVYELANVRVPAEGRVVAVPKSGSGQGEQVAEGRVRVDFHGQVGVVDLRLPGQGKVIARLEIEQTCGTPPCFAQVIGPAAITYGVWDEREQSVGPRTIEVTPDGATGLVTFDKVPARQNVKVETVRNPVGYSSATAYLAFDGDVRNVSLRMKDVGDVTGRVFSHDRQTPLAGAVVRFSGGPVSYAPQVTAPDGSFRFAAIGANVAFRLTAESNADGVYRTGHVDARTPQGGGPVADLVIVMREQSTIEGTVVDLANAPVPLAKYWARELAWPYRSFGSSTDPLHSDLGGRFVITNVFTGPFRITAVAPNVQEIRGDYQGTLVEEGDSSQRAIRIAIGGAGAGAVSVTVVDPLQAFIAVPNAEVALFRNGTRFDFTTSDDNGAASFEQIPAGTYRVTAYSKGLGRAGSTSDFTVAADQTSTQRIQLELRGTVTGSVSDPESEPAPDAPVKGAPVTLDSRAISTRTSTGSDGRFEFLGVPEGNFQLTAFDLDSGRIGIGPPGLFINSLITEQKDIRIALERYASLNVKAYLPNDTGGQGQLAPLVDVALVLKYHRHGSVFAARGAQGAGEVTFPKLISRYWYEVTVRELGGESRVARASGGFETPAKSIAVTFPSSGSVEVKVVDAAGQPVADALVNINDRRLYTPASGIVTVTGVPFGWISVTASKGSVSASSGAHLGNRVEPLRFTLDLGSRIAVAGRVDAEQGIGVPSPGTRVLLNVTSSLLSGGMRLETMTDANGHYTFHGIPVGNTLVDLKFYGPDDTTIGATHAQAIPNGTTGTVAIPAKKLDATPPRVLTIDPSVNATSVAPNAIVTVTFSEPVAASFLNTNWFQLVATDDSSIVNVAFQPSVRPDGTYVVKLIPPAPPAGQTFPLKSNVLYRLALPQGIQDTTGNAMRAAVGSNFTTVDYAEPAVVRVEPVETAPIPANATFRVKFNKPVDVTSFDEGGGGVLRLEKLDAYRGNVVSIVPSTRQLDPADPTTVLLAPAGVAIAESSFYRLTIANARDTQTPPNVQKDVRLVEYFSFDTKKPVVRIVAPAAGTKLVQGVLYTASVELDDTDIAAVDFFDAGDNLLKRVRTAPFAYSFVASGTSMTLKASATDLSGNTSASLAEAMWEVMPNNAPANVVVTNTPASAYPAGTVATSVSFEDEGVSVTVALELRGTRHSDNTAFTQLLGSKNVTRPFSTTFNYALPLDVKAAEIVATVTDSVNKSGTASAPLAILADTTAPVIVSLLPKAESRFRFNETYTVELRARDAETGLKNATITVGGVTLTGLVETFAAGIRTYRKDIVVPPRNADTRVTISATVTDHRDNSATSSADVVYERVDDATLPRAAWITPLDGAALPAGQAGWLTTLRVEASDDTKVTAVRFESPALAAPVTVTTPKAGTTDVFETKAALAMTAGTPFVVKAIVSDGDPAHDVELPITLDPVALSADAPAVVSANLSITSSNVELYRNKSLAVRGPNGLVYVTVPLELKDVMLLDGAVLSTIEETRLDLRITDRVFIDADSAVDVTDRGFLGGWRKRQDNSLTNASATGRSVGSGAVSADGSHGGFGGSAAGATNATYGSLTEPVDFGSGGAGSAAGDAGGNGGGAVSLQANRIVIAGGVRADGGPAGYWRGSGGSVIVDARALITGPATRVTANGADQTSAANLDLGGGGGRMSIRATERFDVDASLPILQARGGRHYGPELATTVGGGAGTIHLLRPGAPAELVVSNFDERFPTTVHTSAATPLWSAATPVAAFDARAAARAAAETAATAVAALQIGPRALVRFDEPNAIPLTIHATARVVHPADLPTLTLVSTTPATAPQHTSITARYTAASAVGIREVRTILGVQPSDVAAYPGFVASVAETASTIAVPAIAPPGPTTLKLRVTDRAGRTAESAPVTITVVENTPPLIETFTVTPPDESYAGRSLAVTASARDDVAVTSLTLASSLGTVSGQFNVAIPPATPGDTNIVLTLTASDGFPNRAAVTATKTIKVKKDLIAPSMTVVSPQPNAQLQEAAGATFLADVTASDAEVAVKSVVARFEGADRALTFASGRYTVAIPVPSVDGTEPVAKTLIVTATDYEGNVTTTNVPLFVKPLIDPNGPALEWSCSSPGALYPAGFTAPIRVFAKGATAANALQSVAVTVDGIAQSVSTAGTDLYQASFAIPAAAAVGTTYAIRVVATSTGGNESTLLGTLTVAGGVDISTASTIDTTDLAFENLSFVVRSGGTLLIRGPHRFGTITILSGGTVVQQHAGLARADAITLDRLYIACGGRIDVSRLGHTGNVQAPGAGWGEGWAGGSHIGSGAIVIRAAGGAFGSVYRPAEMGGSGQSDTASPPGGGAARIVASGPIAIDGAITALSGNVTSAGTGAGGSVWLSTPSALTGAGSIDASGANATHHGAGGGGAIALDYGSASGTLLSSLRAFGGSAVNSGKHAAPGSIYRRGASSAFGDLTIAGNTSSLFSPTVLPPFGRRIAGTVDGATVTLANADWLAPSLAGHWVRAIAPDGTTRGTWRIASVTNHATARTWTSSFEIRVQDSVAYDGYIVHSDAGLGPEKRRWAAARFNGQWQYDNDLAFVNFTPAAGDVIVASFSKNASRITDLRMTPCCSTINGIPAVAMVSGELVPNTIAGPYVAYIADPSEIYVGSDGRGRGVALSGGAPSIALEGTPSIQPGDVLQGVYRFDTVTLANARVVTDDLVDVGQLTKDAVSSLTSGNTAAPLLTGAPFLVKGLDGPMVIAPAGSVSDADGVDAVARVATAIATPTAFENVYCVLFDLAPSLVIRRAPNGRLPPADGGLCGASATRVIGSNGAVAFSAAQTNRELQAGLVVNDTTLDFNEPNHNSFRLRANGTYEVWANGVNANRSSAYSATTVFRIEKTPASLRWLVDGVRVHESSASVPATARFDVSFPTDGGELRGVEYETGSLDLPSSRVAAAADGSFRVVLRARPGDAIIVKARDRHRNALESRELAAGIVPADFTIASLAFAPAEVTGGRTTTGTVTLPSPAGPDGAKIELLSSSATVLVPSTMTIAAGQTSGTFPATTTAVATPVEAIVTASWGAVSQTATLRVVKDNIAPSLTVALPMPNAEVIEGSANAIAVQVTATDDDSGVQRVFVTLDGVSTDLAKSGSVWSGAVPAPFIDGSANVTKNLTITAVDFNANATTSAAIPIVIKPVTDANPPSIANACAVGRAMFPVAWPAKLRVVAKAPNAANQLHRVEIAVNGVTTTASLVAPDTYELTFVVPDLADGTAVPVRATAFTASGTTSILDGTLVVLRDDLRTISSATTIAASDTSYDDKTVIVTAGTLTIAGPHRFKRLAILGGTVTHAQYTVANPQRVDVTADEVFVACGASIDASGRGFIGVTDSVGATWPGVAASTGISGGSHGGRGGSTSGSAFGSVFAPHTPGGAGSHSFAGPRSCADCTAGGGIVRLDAPVIAIDGVVASNGSVTQDYTGGGAGGSISVNATTLSGAGELRANGAAYFNASGGGGRIAVAYVTSTFDPLRIKAASASAGTERGGPGTIYLRRVDASRAKLSDELVIDDLALGGPSAVLPATTSGSVTSVSGATVNVTEAVPEWIEGAWIDFFDASGARVASAEIVSRTASSITLATAPAIAIPGTYRVVWRFDTITLRNTATLMTDALHVGTIATSATSRVFASSLRGANVTLRGVVDTSYVEATNLSLENGATLTHPMTAGAAIQRLHVNVAGTLTIASGASIDATGRGFAGASGGVGRTWPGVAAASAGGAASHGGRGGVSHGAASAGETYGSVFEPSSPGAAGSTGNYQTNCAACSPGGGVVRIDAASVVLDGAIRANGAWTGEYTQGGAGGSVLIKTGALSGMGEIHADGASSTDTGSGGGRVAVHATSLAFDKSRITAYGGTFASASARAAAGTVFLRTGAGDGELLVIHSQPTSNTTPLPAAGHGTVAFVTANRIGGAAFADSLAGIRAFVRDDESVSWPILANDATSLTLDVAQTPLAASIGDSYRGLSRFAVVKLRNANVTSRDVVAAASIDKDAPSTLVFNAAPPRFPAALRPHIAVASTLGGVFVTGPAGAVVDSDAPIRLTATNVRTAQTFLANANPDGSFSITAGGAIGDTFTLRATDSHALPLASQSIAVSGAIVEGNAVASLALQPASVDGGASATATVRLHYPARNGGVTVSLTSSDPATASVPASVTVAAGAIAAQFTIATTAPASSKSITITASAGNAVAKTLDVLAATSSLTDLAIAPASIEGGAATNGTVTLGAAAPSGGVTVLLASSDSSIAIVPASVVVAAGSTSATLPITTSRVAATTNATITATYGATRSATVNLTACAALAKAPQLPSAPSPLWWDDAAPSGGTATGGATFDTTQAAWGTHALHFAPATGVRSWNVTGAAPFVVTPGDRIVLHALVNPCNPPRQLQLTFSDGTTALHASWGESLIEPVMTPARIGAMPRGGAWTRLELSPSALGIASSKSFTSMQIQVHGGEAWIDTVGLASCTLSNVAAPQHRADEMVWFDDALPAGAVEQSGGSARPWVWDAAHFASGTRSHTDTLESAAHHHGFTGASEKLTVAAGDVLFVWALLDPCNPPRQIYVGFANGADWAHGAFWGENRILPQTRIPHNTLLGVMPEAGKWVRLEIPAGLVDVEGLAIDGIGFAAYGGRAWFDRVGKTSRVNLAQGKAVTQTATYREVDLGSVQPIEDLQLCCGLADFTVYVSDIPFAATRAAIEAQPGVARLAIPGTASRPMSLRVDRAGRYVRIYRNDNAVPQLTALDVWAPLSARRVNLAIGQLSARQSSTIQPLGRAEHAVNGDLSGGYAERGSTTHTSQDAQAWWDVDLGRIAPISSVDVFLRTNTEPNPVAPGDEITNFYVFVSDQPFASNDLAATIAQPGVSTYVYGAPPRSSHEFPIHRTGRYVRVQISNAWYLFLSEVRVWSHDALLSALAKKVSE
jgi:Bacterial Ig-like domain/Carboxypeptidase regulatory-like domain